MTASTVLNCFSDRARGFYSRVRYRRWTGRSVLKKPLQCRAPKDAPAWAVRSENVCVNMLQLFFLEQYTVIITA